MLDLEKYNELLTDRIKLKKKIHDLKLECQNVVYLSAMIIKDSPSVKYRFHSIQEDIICNQEEINADIRLLSIRLLSITRDLQHMSAKLRSLSKNERVCMIEYYCKGNTYKNIEIITGLDHFTIEKIIRMATKKYKNIKSL